MYYKKLYIINLAIFMIKTTTIITNNITMRLLILAYVGNGIFTIFILFVLIQM